jgi:hypothetical protein
MAQRPRCKKGAIEMMGYQAVRKSVITLAKSGNLAVANEVAGYEVPPGLLGRVQDVEIFLGNTGGTSGQTSVDVKKNGVSILAAVLSIAQGSATKRVRTATLVFGAAGPGEPAGVDFAPGDYFRVDVTAIPGTTSADLIASLQIVEKDV